MISIFKPQKCHLSSIALALAPFVIFGSACDDSRKGAGGLLDDRQNPNSPDNAGGDEFISQRRRNGERPAEGPAFSQQDIEDSRVICAVNEFLAKLRVAPAPGDLAGLRNLFPSYEAATPKIKTQMFNVSIGVCTSDTIPIKQRMDFAWDLLPVDISPNAIDDAIRIATPDDLGQVDQWLRNKPSGPSRTKLFRLIAQRMERMGVEREATEKWILTLEIPAEREAALRVLDDGL